MVTRQTENKEKKIKDSKDDDFKREEIPYRNAIDSLLYLANLYMPDIAYTVHVLSQRSYNFNKNYWQAIK